MTRRIRDYSKLIPEMIDWWEEFFTPDRKLKAVLTLNGMTGNITLVDTDGVSVTVNVDTRKVTVGNATALRGISLATNVGTPNDNDVLRYDAATGKWTAEALP